MFRHIASFLIVLPLILTPRLPLLIPRSPAYHRGHLNWVIVIVVAMRAFQSTHLPILPFTNILYMLQKSNHMWCHIFHAYFRLHATGLLEFGMSLKFAAPNYGPAFGQSLLDVASNECMMVDTI